MRCSESHIGDLGECTRSRRWVVAPLGDDIMVNARQCVEHRATLRHGGIEA
jgi:hypothetical protein